MVLTALLAVASVALVPLATNPAHAEGMFRFNQEVDVKYNKSNSDRIYETDVCKKSNMHSYYMKATPKKDRVYIDADTSKRGDCDRFKRMVVTITVDDKIVKRGTFHNDGSDRVIHTFYGIPIPNDANVKVQYDVYVR